MRVADGKTDLRRGVDHIGISAAAIIHDSRGKILLMQRGPKARDENGRWDIVGGAIEFGESIDDALVREVSEELCTEPFDIKFLGAYDAHREHNGDKTHWICLLHCARIDKDKIQIGEPEKIAALGWFGLEDIPTPQHSMLHKALAAAKEVGIVT
ncbi:NUDIX hydrolase [Candidatus Saccharibacteria bacterium]|nr:NUDIX hydrolase [Candidatus Saccharibacteria bacterium]